MDNSVRNNEIGNLAQSRCSQCGVSHPTEKFSRQHQKVKLHEKTPFNDKIRPYHVQQKDTKDTVGRYIVFLQVENADSCQHDSK